MELTSHVEEYLETIYRLGGQDTITLPLQHPGQTRRGVIAPFGQHKAIGARIEKQPGAREPLQQEAVAKSRL